MKFSDFAKVINMRRIGVISDDILSRGEFDKLTSRYSFTINGLRGTYTELFPDRSLAISTNKDRFFSEDSHLKNGVRLLFKPTILNRLDYHLSMGWPGGVFVDQSDSSDLSKDASYSPYELEKFFDHLQSSYDHFLESKRAGKSTKERVINEVVFKGAISFDQIEKILVRPHFFETTRKLLDAHGYPNISIEVLGEVPHEMHANCHSNPEINSAAGEKQMQVYGKVFMELAKFIESHPDDPEVKELVHKKRETADPSHKDVNKLLELQRNSVH
jgi:hypothetical protein